MIRLAAKGDTEAIRALAVEAFSRFGDYGTFLPRYLIDPWVRTIVRVGAGELVGFAMVGLTASRRQGGVLVADILAIAVTAAYQGRGIGTALMERALAMASALAGRYGVDEVELSVADTNPGALRFFARHGFVVADADEGRYPAGQVAIRMSRPLPPSSS
ncbi:MAG: GNAT family N-acetyltransferase [Deltaproteobacteria bacterium]|nr:GNAT family N-acetyltransferase [Deltaproteobacteria bacterium]